MKVLFAVHDEKVSLSIVKKYQKEYKEIISYKNVYYFNAILKELQRDKSYDRVVIDEELEEFTSTSFEEKDKFIFNKLDGITDEASNTSGKDIPIILICSDRRTKSEEILVKIFGIGIYNAIIGNDRSTDEVCRLINSPRSKKDAKVYYKIDSKNVDYDPERENDVSEEEMQHILSYFKKLGKKEEKYAEAFSKIASQYNKEQLKIIATILPTNVKMVLQEQSQEYQGLISASGGKIKRTLPSKKASSTSEKLLDAKTKKSSKPIVVPSSIDKNIIKKVSIKKPTVNKIDDYEENDDEFEEIQTINKKSIKTKEQIEQEERIEPVKKRRGRPPKKQMEETFESKSDIDEFEDILSENEEEKYNRIDDSLLRPITQDEYEENEEIDYDDDYSDEYDDYDENEDVAEEINYNASLPGLFEDEEDNEEENEEHEYKEEEPVQEFRKNVVEESWENEISPRKDIQKYNHNIDDYDYTNYNSLLSSNKKVIAFVGTSKNGTSFIINNVAKILSDSGIDTAILDTTQNKNSYYIYNKNDDRLRIEAANSIENLINGEQAGMKVSKNLSVYVEVPNTQDTKMYNVGPILEKAIENHSAVLIDCDFNTPLEYFAKAQEIYLVQSMDVLTIQPLTAFLKELKNRDILDSNKLRIIVNKSIRLKGITARQIVGGMSNYNNPEMSIMTELFDRNSIVPIEIPFDVDVYAKYLEGIAECNVAINKYPKDFQSTLKKLAYVIYPLLPNGKSKDKHQKGYQYSTTYSNGFSNSVNNTLNNMKKNY